MGDDVGQHRPGHRVDEEQHGKHGHRQAYRAPRRFQQQQDTDDADRHVKRRRIAWPEREFLVEDDQIQRGDRTADGKQPVLPGHVVARRLLERRKRQKRKEEAEREMDRARLGVVEQTETES